MGHMGYMLICWGTWGMGMGHGAHVDMLGHMPKSHVAVDPMLDFLC